MTARVGQQFGNYRLIRLLGRGGFAEVYLGEHLRLKTQTAIKILHTWLEEDEGERFLHEAQTVARLKHPHIVRIFDFAIEAHTPFLVMDYLPNGNIRRSYPKGTRLPLRTIIDYVSQVASALQYAHNAKLIHRDIKPENMLLDQHNTVVLSDFGISLIAQNSRDHRTQEIAGTAAYMAPEQFQGKPCQASDQYALGVVVYEWLSGDRPFQGSFAEIVSQHALVPPPSLQEKVPTLIPTIEQVVLTALEKESQRRFASVQDFARALEQACQASPQAITLPPEATLPGQPFPAIDTVATRKSRQLLQSVNTVSPSSQLAQSLLVNALSPPPIDMTSLAGVPVRSDSPQPPQWRASRRIVLIGLAGLAGAGSGMTWLAQTLSQKSQVSLRHSPPTSTRIPLGRTLLTYHGHSGAISTARWSPDGTRIASASYDGTVQVWNVTNGSHIYAYHGNSTGALTVAWSPNGLRIASGSLDPDHSVQVWDAINGDHVFTYSGHSGSVHAVTWNGTRIASGSDDGTVQVWDAVDGRNVLTYKGHSSSVYTVAWSPDGMYIASGGDDQTVQVWNATTGTRLYTYSGHVQPVDNSHYPYDRGVNAVAWSPRSTRIASASWDTTVQVWDAFNGGNVLTYRGHSNSVFAVAWSPDSMHIASASGDGFAFAIPDNTVQIWQASNGKHIYTYHGHQPWVHAAAWAPDSTRIASGGEDSTVQVWQAI